jgi:CRISPR-associated protein Csy1
MLDPAIQDFLNERKGKWLTSKISGKTTKEEMVAFEELANEKFTLENWLPFEATRAKQIAITSHPAKFSHPSIKKDQINFKANIARKSNDGFIRTGNVDVELDGFGGAAGLAAYNFLNVVLADGNTILQHLEEETEVIKRQFNIPGHSFTEIRLRFLKVQQADENNAKTHGRIKQVYFPTKDKYHLLSILTPSGLVFKLKEKIKNVNFSNGAKEAREAKRANKLNEQGFSEIYSLSVIGYGGNKPQNISVLNNENGGTAYLLSSMPPVLTTRTIQPPRINFFSDSLWTKAFTDDFQKFHNQLIAESNNIHIRKKRDRLIRSILFQVADQLWRIRHLDAGWSNSDNYQHLPLYQKIWLDQLYADKREEDLYWFDSVSKGISRWFINTYSKLLGNNALPLGDEHLLHIEKLIEDCEGALQ